MYKFFDVSILMFVIQVLISSRGSEDQELKKSEAEL
jgi:hypothetical protein